MSNPWKLALVILAVVLLQTHSKPFESTDEGLSEMERDLASLSVLSDDQKQDAGEDKIPESLLKDLQESQDDKHQTKPDEDKIPESLLADLLKSSDETSHQTNPIDQAALQGFAPGTATDEESEKAIDTSALQGFAPGTATDGESEKTMETRGVLLSEDDINDKQKRLFEILSREESEDNPKNSETNAPGEEEEKNKIPEDLLKDLLEAKNHEDQPKKLESTWLEPTDKNDEVKKGIMNAILMDEIVNKIKEKNKRGERISDKVLNLLEKYNSKRSGRNL